jgi:hypothetical protein
VLRRGGLLVTCEIVPRRAGAFVIRHYIASARAATINAMPSAAIGRLVPVSLGAPLISSE